MKSAPPPMQPSKELEHWIPIHLKNGACEWLFTGEKEFTEPFFDQTIAACRFASTHNRRYKILSGLEMMTQWAADIRALPPSAIIFHVSRCGSTLLSQLLAEDQRHLVLSEVPFFDELLRLPLQEPGVGTAAAEDHLRAALTFYGRQRHDGQQHLLIKTDSWHLHFYEQYRRLFPGIPFFLLYRHPLSVIRSQQKQRGMQSVPGLLEPQLFGFTSRQHRLTNLDHYMAAVLESYFKKMIFICQNDPLAVPLDYATGMHTIIKQVYTHLNRPIGKSLEHRFAQRGRFHAKYPDQLFTGEQQPTEVPVFLKRGVALYDQLQSINAALPAAQ